jgi:hypothetical protein
MYGGQSLNDIEALAQKKRGSPSQIIIQGKYSYGIENISLATWGEGANLHIGSFN